MLSNYTYLSDTLKGISHHEIDIRKMDKARRRMNFHRLLMGDMVRLVLQEGREE